MAEDDISVRARAPPLSVLRLAMAAGFMHLRSEPDAKRDFKRTAEPAWSNRFGLWNFATVEIHDRKNLPKRSASGHGLLHVLG